jgi:hypothetical protein
VKKFSGNISHAIIIDFPIQLNDEASMDGHMKMNVVCAQNEQEFRLTRPVEFPTTLNKYLQKIEKRKNANAAAHNLDPVPGPENAMKEITRLVKIIENYENCGMSFNGGYRSASCKLAHLILNLSTVSNGRINIELPLQSAKNAFTTMFRVMEMNGTRGIPEVGLRSAK